MRLVGGHRAFPTMEEERAQLCAPSGRVARAQSITERSPARPRGFGCVEIPNATEAQAAMAGLRGTPVAGRTLTVYEAHRREGEQRLPRRDHPRGPRGKREADTRQQTRVRTRN